LPPQPAEIQEIIDGSYLFGLGFTESESYAKSTQQKRAEPSENFD